MKRRVILAILDGWGIGRRDFTNPIHAVQPKNINYLKTHYFSGSLQASGIAVGLPWDEEGNSEVGHLNLGAGKVIYQHFPKITLSIERGEFFKNPALLKAFAHAKAHSSAVHLIGLVSEGNVHASLEHLRALMMFAKRVGCENLNLQLFSDGKDSRPKSAIDLLGKIKKIINDAGVGAIVSLSGRFYALDRDGYWERTEKTYRVLTGTGETTEDLDAHIRKHYERGLSDEFIEPTMVAPHRPVKDNDALIFFNFREDSMRQIAASFILKDFDKFPTQKFKNLYLVTMTHYADNLAVPVAFANETVDQPLGRVLSDNGRVQLRIAETEKYAHVTYFFNGYLEKPFANEYRVLIPSPGVARHDEAPEMMAREVAARTLEAIDAGGTDFILVNFANPDVIAHTGNYDAALQAVLVVDEEIGRLSKACLNEEIVLLITSDHGNIERMIDPLTGRAETQHDPSLVPIYLVGRGFERPKSDWAIEIVEKEAVGILSDVAPTVLELMGLPKPAEMTGESLLKVLR